MAHPGISSEWPKNMIWNFWIASKDWHAKMHIQIYFHFDEILEKRPIESKKRVFFAIFRKEAKMMVFWL